MKCIPWVREPVYEAGRIVGCREAGGDMVLCTDCRSKARKSEQARQEAVS